MERDSRKLIRLLQEDGWYLVGATGSHHHFKHPVKTGKVTVPHPKHNLPTGTAKSILKQAGISRRNT